MRVLLLVSTVSPFQEVLLPLDPLVSGPRFCGSNCFEVGKSFDTADPVKVLVNVKRAEVCQWYCIQDTRCWFFVYHLKDAGAALEYKCILLGWKAPVNGPEAAHLVRGPKLCP